MTHTPQPEASTGQQILDRLWEAMDTTRAAIKERDQMRKTNTDLLAALEDMDKAFISRHGCFPTDRVTPEQIVWNDAMTQARTAIAKAKAND